MRSALFILLVGCSAEKPPEPQQPAAEAHDADFEAASATELLSAYMVALGYQSQPAIAFADAAQHYADVSGCPEAVGDDTYVADGCESAEMVWDGRARLWAEDMDAMWYAPAPDIDISFEAFSATSDTDHRAFDGSYAMQVDETTVHEQIDLAGIAPGFASTLRTSIEVDCDVDTEVEILHARDCVIASGGEGEVEGLGAFAVAGSYHVETENNGVDGSLNLTTRAKGELELAGEQTVVFDPATHARPDGTKCATFAIDGADRVICWDPYDGLYTAWDDGAR